MQKRSVPIREGRGIEDIGLDRAKQCRDHGRVKMGNGSRKRSLAIAADGPSLSGIQIVNRRGTQIDQVTTGPLKHTQKIFIADRRVHLSERVAHGAVQARVALVKESSRGRRRFAYE